MHSRSPSIAKRSTTEIANQATCVTDQLVTVVSLNFGDFGENGNKLIQNIFMARSHVHWCKDK